MTVHKLGKFARGGIAALMAMSFGIAAGCATTNGGDVGGESEAARRVGGFHDQAQLKIRELVELKGKMEELLAKFLKYGEEAKSLAVESDMFPEGYEMLSDLKERLTRRRAQIVETYRSEVIIPDFEKAGLKADEISSDIDGLFDKARKSIFVHYVADRSAKRRHDKLWKENKADRDSAMAAIQKAKEAFNSAKSDIIASGERLNSNIARLEDKLRGMPKEVLLLDDSDRKFDESIKGERGEDVVSRPSLVPKGDEWHRFKFWSSKKGGEEYKGFGRDTFITAPRTLWAVFEEIPVKATFFSDDSGKPFSEVPLYRTKSGRLEAPSKSPERWGHTFLGWARKGDQGLYTGFGTALMEDVELVARWEEAPFKVSFRDFDGNELETRTLRLSQEIFGSFPEVPGYRYDGWSLKKGGERIAVGAKLADCIKAPAKELTLFAVREVETHKAVFIGLGGKKIGEAEGSAEKAAVAPAAPQVDGYRFDGWFVGDDECFKGGKMKIPSDMTVTAKYTPVTFKATFFDGEGKGKLDETEFSIEKPLQLPEPPRILGFKTAWSLASEGKAFRKVDTNAAKDLSIYAVRMIPYRFVNWGKNLFSGEAAFGSVVTPPALIDTMTGKPRDPDGWAFSSNENRDKFIDFAKFRMERETTFCAVWPQEEWGGSMPQVETAETWARMRENAGVK